MRIEQKGKREQERELMHQDDRVVVTKEGRGGGEIGEGKREINGDGKTLALGW